MQHHGRRRRKQGGPESALLAEAKPRAGMRLAGGPNLWLWILAWDGLSSVTRGGHGGPAMFRRAKKGGASLAGARKLQELSQNGCDLEKTNKLHRLKTAVLAKYLPTWTARGKRETQGLTTIDMRKIANAPGVHAY